MLVDEILALENNIIIGILARTELVFSKRSCVAWRVLFGSLRTASQHHVCAGSNWAMVPRPEGLFSVI
jgi:hypothetical protein